MHSVDAYANLVSHASQAWWAGGGGLGAKGPRQPEARGVAPAPGPKRRNGQPEEEEEEEAEEAPDDEVPEDEEGPEEGPLPGRRLLSPVASGSSLLPLARR